jgi:hypothetical protein
MPPRLKAFLAALVVMPLLAHAAQESRPLLSQLGRTAFSFDVPAGWHALDITLRYQYAEPLYELTPALPDDPASFYAPRPRIFVMYYRNKVPSEAAYRWEISGGYTELPPRKELPTWRLSEVPGRNLAAYTMLGKDVVVIGLSCTDSAQFEEAKPVLLSILASYEVVEQD